MRKRLQAALATAAGAALIVPLTINATSASWNDREWVNSTVGTGSLACDGATPLASQSRGTFLAGQLLGIDLDALAQLEQMTLSVDAAGNVAFAPGDAIDLGSTPPTYTYANPFDVTALSTLTVNLTGFAVPLPGAALGAANQWTQVSTSGNAAGASGLINDSGAVLVSDSTPSDQLPAPATLDITALLPAVPGVDQAVLEVGAVAASSQLDGCAALREQIWGIDPAQPVAQRNYGIAGLDLVIDAPAIGALTGAVTATVGELDAAIAALQGSNGLISQALRTNLDLVVPGVTSAALTGTVTISGLDLASTVAPFLGLTLDGNGFRVDLANGQILVDIERLTGPLNNAAPNTELVLNATVINEVVSEAGQLLDEWSSDVRDAITGALRAAQLQISLSTQVSAINITLADVTLSLNATIGAVMDGNATIAVTATALGGLPALLNTLLAAAGLPTLNGILSALTGSGPALTTALVNLLTTQLFDRVTTLGSTLSTLSAPVVNALAGVVNALPSVVSLMVNVQPDQPGAPPGSSFIPAGPQSTAEYAVTALRLGLADFDTPSDIAHVRFATGSAGPVTLP